MLDGHSFSEEQLAALPHNGKRREIVLLTAKTMLVPGELFVAEEGEETMRLNGMAPTPEETILHVEDPHRKTVALMAVDRRIVERLRAAKGREIRWNTPLLHSPENTNATFWIRREENLVYMKCWSDRLLLAEVLVVPTAEDLLFFVTEFLREMEFRPQRILIEGASARQEGRFLQKYFKQIIVCE